MIRKATVNDAEQLSVLNEEFNGKGETKKSFCYDEYMPEITEVYVNPTYRKKRNCK